jgi:hypothetical protein
MIIKINIYENVIGDTVDIGDTVNVFYRDRFIIGKLPHKTPKLKNSKGIITLIVRHLYDGGRRYDGSQFRIGINECFISSNEIEYITYSKIILIEKFNKKLYKGNNYVNILIRK